MRYLGISLTRCWGVAKWVRFRSILPSRSPCGNWKVFFLGIPQTQKCQNKSWWWLWHLTWGQGKNFSWRWLLGWNHQKHHTWKYLTSGAMLGGLRSRKPARWSWNCALELHQSTSGLDKDMRKQKCTRLCNWCLACFLSTSIGEPANRIYGMFVIGKWAVFTFG